MPPLTDVANAGEDVSRHNELGDDDPLDGSSLLSSTLEAESEDDQVLDYPATICEQHQQIRQHAATIMLTRTPPAASRVPDISSLYLNPTLSDLTLMVQGEYLPAHKVLVCLRSATLHAILTQQPDSKEVELADCTLPAVKAMLRYIYCTIIPEEELKELSIQLLPLAYRYKIPDLLLYVQAHCMAVMSKDNVKEMLMMAQQLRQQDDGSNISCKELLDKDLQFMVQHAQLLTKPDCMVDLDQGALQAVVLALVQHHQKQWLIVRRTLAMLAAILAVVLLAVLQLEWQELDVLLTLPLGSE